MVCSALIAAAYLCLQYHNVHIRRLGVWLIFASLIAGAWFVSHSWLLEISILSAWFAVPLSQTIYLSRILRFSKEAELKPGNLLENTVEDLSTLTHELREADFILDRDYWLVPSPIQHGFRLFNHREKPVCAAISLIKQGGLSLWYVQFITVDETENLWITWDFPLSYNMEIPPELKIYRCLKTSTAKELLEQHEAYLQLNEVSPNTKNNYLETAQIFNQINQAIIRYNLKNGLLRSYPRSNNLLGYSWRGTWFISRKVLWEMVAG
jgi:hypothetical protein